MAHIEFSGMETVLKKLEKLSDKAKVDAIAMKAVNAAQPSNESAMRSAIAAVEHGPYATGSVSASISSTKAKVNDRGVFAAARPTGRDSRGIRNGEKAALLQYGTSKMAARPWKARAVNAAKGECIRIMTDVVRTEMELE